MPAKYIRRDHDNEGYFHIFNKGISGKTIFKDEQDYEIFLNYLKDYLTPPALPDTYKKNFTVKGRIFRGMPHKPKNYFDKVHLIAYNLMPNHFHLLLQQKNKGFLEKFMRSLSTRYSMYFNKRYQCTGPLFVGPYKSVYINGISPLLHLTRYLHRGNKSNEKYSSYAEYLGKRETLWVEPNVVLSSFNNSENKAFRGIAGYKNFVEKYESGQEDGKLLEGIILEKEDAHLAGSSPLLAGSSPSEDITPSYNSNTPRLTEITITTAVFLLLFSFGFRNVWLASTLKNTSPSPTPSVAGTEDEKSKITLMVKISNGMPSINIRQAPTTQSEVIGEAKDGDILEFVSINSGWYGVKLADKSVGYIWSEYIEILEEENK